MGALRQPQPAPRPRLQPCERCRAWVRTEAEATGPVWCPACEDSAPSRTSSPFSASPYGTSPPVDRPFQEPLPRIQPSAWQHWCEHHSPWPRLPVLVLLFYWAVRSILDPQYYSVFDGINLGIHEIGHVVFTGAGELMHFLGGTLLQCAAPVAAGVMLWRQHDWFGMAFAGTWLGTNLHGVAIYMGDARAQSLPLVSLGTGEAMHDWAYLLGRFGLLQQDRFLAGCVRAMAITMFLAAVAWGAWVVWNLFRYRSEGSRF